MNNKNLGILFGALLLIYLASKMFGGNRERSFDPVIVQLDTSKVDRIEVSPGQEGTPFTLQRSKANWVVKEGDRSYAATSNSVQSLLTNMREITADRVVTKNPEKYADFDLDDVKKTQITLYHDDKKLGGIEVGRFSYNQTTRNGISYLKRADDPEVFSIEGFLSMTLKQSMDNYRDKLVLKTSKDDLTRISYRSDDKDLSYSLNQGTWVNAAGEHLDSAAMVSYLNSLGAISGNTFADDAADVGGTVGRLTLEGNNMTGPIEIDCYESQDSSHHFVIASSENKEGRFFSDSSGIYRRLIGDLLQVELSK